MVFGTSMPSKNPSEFLTLKALPLKGT